MATDINIHDDHIAVTGGKLAVDGEVEAAGPVTLKDELGVTNDHNDVTVTLHNDRNRTGLTIGGLREANQPRRASLSLRSHEGSCTLTGTRLTGLEQIGVGRIAAKDAGFTSLTLGYGETDESDGSNGNLEVRNATGEVTVAVDGVDGDIVLATIGSLVAKLSDLQAQIDALTGAPSPAPVGDVGPDPVPVPASGDTDAGGGSDGGGNPGNGQGNGRGRGRGRGGGNG